MRLLVKRDRNSLVPCGGKAYLENGTPEIFSVPRHIPEEQVTSIENRSDLDDLLLAKSEDYKTINSHLNQTGIFRQKGLIGRIFGKNKPKIMNGIWSGYRSAIVQDPQTSKLFKLKGIALNVEKPKQIKFDDGIFWIQGGQKKKNVGYERVMSGKFNQVLRDNGITPAMEYKGMWEYPNLVKGTRPVASIYEVQGDTRLDELMLLLDSLAFDRMQESDTHFTRNGEKFNVIVEYFYHDIGYKVGRMKRLMDKSGQTWSCDSERTNAHTGNIVLWRDANKLKIGLVDFDASMDLDEISKSEMEALQKKEYEDIIQSAICVTSLRQINGRLNREGSYYIDFRDKFSHGFSEGYTSTSNTYSSEMDISFLDELFALLRSDEPFTKTIKKRHVNKVDKWKYREKYNKKEIDIEDVVKEIYYYKDKYECGDDYKDKYGKNDKDDYRLSKYFISKY